MARPVPIPLPAFADGAEHLLAELAWLDLLIARAVRAQRLVAPPEAAVYISDAEVDRLLTAPRVADVPPDPGLDEQITTTRAALDEAADQGLDHGVDLPLAALARRLGLTAFEWAALLVCLAPELDRRYDRLYAYLQDDLARCRPSVDLVTGLLAPTTVGRWRALRHLGPAAPLRASGVLEIVVDDGSPSGSTALAQMLHVAPRVVRYVLGDDRLDGALLGHARRVRPGPGTAPSDPDGAIARLLADLVRRHTACSADALLLHLHGRDGAGRAELACAVAARLGLPIVALDVATVPAGRLAEIVEITLRECRLTGAAAVLRHAERLLDDAEAPAGSMLGAALDRHPVLVLLTAERPWPLTRPPGRAVLHEVEVAGPNAAARRALWSAAAPMAPPELHTALAGRFRLTPGQIREVGADVRRRTGTATTRAQDWYAGCRRVSGGALAALAHKVTLVHGWDDLVLDDHRRDLLRAMRDEVRHRERVLDEWGLGNRIAGRGLSALFSGPPGTGKTMAAGVVAADLGLHLYRVDLARVVSKYIGETEKNLARIFAEAQACDAVLLFDEADALFGKRTEVSDAHDRYANIEVSYLLTRMEDHEGIAVLSSNLAQHMDEAFLRRLRFVVEFPFPGAAARRRIWEVHLAAGAPLADDVDLDLLAQRLALSGGSIRNVVVSASFLAAADGARVGMDQLVRAARREFDKTGTLWPDLGEGTPKRRGVDR